MTGNTNGFAWRNIIYSKIVVMWTVRDSCVNHYPGIIVWKQNSRDSQYLAYLRSGVSMGLLNNFLLHHDVWILYVFTF